MTAEPSWCAALLTAGQQFQPECFTSDDTIVFVFCICVFVHLCICVFVFLTWLYYSSDGPIAIHWWYSLRSLKWKVSFTQNDNDCIFPISANIRSQLNDDNYSHFTSSRRQMSSRPDDFELFQIFRPGWTPRFILSLQGQRHLTGLHGVVRNWNVFVFVCLCIYILVYLYFIIRFHGATKAQLQTQLPGAVLLLLWRFANTWGRGCGMRSWEPLCLPPILCLLLLLLLKSIDVQFHSMVNSKMYKCKQRTKPKDKWYNAACGKLSSLVLSSPRPSLVGPLWSFVGLLYCYCCCYCYWWAHPGHL